MGYQHKIPTSQQRALLKAAMEKPTDSRPKWAAAAGINLRTVEKWFAREDFMKWFTKEFMGPAKARAPMLLEKIMRDAMEDGASDKAVDRAIRVMERLDWCGMRPEMANLPLGQPSRMELNVNLTPSRDNGGKVIDTTATEALPEPDA